MDYELSIGDYWRLLKRRLPIFISAALATLLLGTVIVFSLPPKYKSVGTILVESQQIPTELIQSTITSVAQERIRVIQQRVMTRPNLIKIIDKYGLFDDTETRPTETEMVDAVRKRIAIEIRDISRRPNNRRANEETAVVFTVTYEDQNRQRALRVTNEFVTLFLEENVRARTTRASDTTQFLTGEVQRLEAELTQIETRIADYKQSNSDALPEHNPLKLAKITRINDDLDRIDANIQQAHEDLRLADLEISAMQSGRSTDSNQNFSPASEINQLQNQLAALRLTYLDEHPEIQSVLGRIKVLKEQMAELDERKALSAQLVEAEAERESLVPSKGVLDEGVKKLDAHIADLKKRISTLGGDDPLAEAGAAAELQEARLRYRKTALEERIQKWTNDRAALTAEIVQLEDSIQRSQEVESNLKREERAYQSALKQFNEVNQKQQGALLAENLEEDQKAERFLLLEPPVLAETPSSPNRKNLMVIVVVLSMGMAAVIAFARDIITGTLYSPTQLEHALGGVRAISVPHIYTEAEKRSRRKLYLYGAVAVPVLGLLGLLAIHILFMPLDVVYYKIMARL